MNYVYVVFCFVLMCLFRLLVLLADWWFVGWVVAGSLDAWFVLSVF